MQQLCEFVCVMVYLAFRLDEFVQTASITLKNYPLLKLNIREGKQSVTLSAYCKLKFYSQFGVLQIKIRVLKIKSEVEMSSGSL